MATDVHGVYADGGKPEQRRLGRVTSAELRAMPFAAGSIGPKVEAAALFVEGTQKRAAIGALAEIEAIVAGRAGTQVLGSNADLESPPGGCTMAAHRHGRK